VWNEAAGTCTGAVVGAQLSLLTTTIGEIGARARPVMCACERAARDRDKPATPLRRVIVAGNPQSIVLAARLSYATGNWVHRGINNVRCCASIRSTTLVLLLRRRVARARGPQGDTQTFTYRTVVTFQVMPPSGERARPTCSRCQRGVCSCTL
jgi:hypothetical protein